MSDIAEKLVNSGMDPYFTSEKMLQAANAASYSSGVACAGAAINARSAAPISFSISTTYCW